jgi:hypothetical protein
LLTGLLRPGAILDAVPFTALSGQYVTEETLFLPLSEDGTT